MIDAQPTRIAAVPAAPGVIRGPWRELRRAALPPPAPDRRRRCSRRDRAAPRGRNDAALELMALSDRVAEAGHEAEAGIFAAHAAIAWDPALIGDAVAAIEGAGTDAGSAIVDAGRIGAARLAAVADPLIRAARPTSWT